LQKRRRESAEEKGEKIETEIVSWDHLFSSRTVLTSAVMVSPMAAHMQMTAGRSRRAVDDRYIRRKAARIISKVTDLPDMIVHLLGFLGA